MMRLRAGLSIILLRYDARNEKRVLCFNGSRFFASAVMLWLRRRIGGYSLCAEQAGEFGDVRVVDGVLHAVAVFALAVWSMSARISLED
jgi:hypothetical protein